MVITVLSLVVAVLFPLYFIYHLWTTSFPTVSAWGVNAATGLAFLGLMLVVGRWDLAGVSLRYGLYGLYALVMIGSGARVSDRPVFANDRWHVSWSALADVAVMLGLVGWTIVGYWPAQPPTNVELPLHGEQYYVVHGGGTYPLNYHGLFASSQTYAVDITQLNEWGVRASGLYPKELQQYNIYGDPVYSPVRGTVVRAVDRFADLTPGNRQPKHPSGNHVWVRQDHLYVVLAHLQQGSIRVSPGDRVAAGQPIGAVGNTGNTSEPHLHVHALAYNGRTSNPDTLHRNGTPVPLAFDGRFPTRNNRFSHVRSSTESASRSDVPAHVPFDPMRPRRNEGLDRSSVSALSGRNPHGGMPARWNRTAQ